MTTRLCARRPLGPLTAQSETPHTARGRAIPHYPQAVNKWQTAVDKTKWVIFYLTLFLGTQLAGFTLIQYWYDSNG